MAHTLRRSLAMVREWVEHKPVALWCVAVVSFLWLAVAVPFLSLHHDGVQPFFSPVNKGNQDFAQYYMGGAVFQEHAFDAMYPDPVEGLRSNVGWPQSSTPKPKYAAIATARGVEDSFRYMLPPPTTALLAPLAYFPYPLARWVWVVVLGACCWGSCFFSYRMSIRMGGSRFVGLIWWGVWAFSPLMLKALRTANSTPVVTMALAVSAWGVFRNKRVLAIGACIVAGLLKGTSLIFAPLIILMKRWQIVIGGALTALAVVLVVAALAGMDVYREFFEVIYPTTRIPDPYSGNQSLFGFLYRLVGGNVLQSPAVAGVKFCGYVLMSVVLFKLWKKKADWECHYPQFNSAVLGLLGIYLVFSPYCWDHYVLFYLPFWTVLWNRLSARLVRVAMVLSAALVWFPLIAMRGVKLAPCEPFQSHMLWGQVILLGVVLWDIWGAERIFHKGGANGSGA